MINGISSPHAQTCRPHFIKTLPFVAKNRAQYSNAFKSASAIESEPKIIVSQESSRENPIIPDEISVHDLDSVGKEEQYDTSATNEIGIFKFDENAHINKMDIIGQFTPRNELKTPPLNGKGKCCSARQSNLSLILSRNKELQKLEGEPTIKVR